MATAHNYLPPVPEIGHPEFYYAELAKSADRSGQIHAHEAAKVGQYVTLAIDPHLDWGTKRRYFRHALRRHCDPPKVAHDLVAMFYMRLADLVRQHAGKEAFRLASAEDDRYAARLLTGESRQSIAPEAHAFFGELIGTEDRCPSYLTEEDWLQLKMIRSQWLPGV